MKTLYFLTITISLGLIMMLVSSCTETEYIERTDTLVVTNTDIMRDTIWDVKFVHKRDTVRETNTIIIKEDEQGNVKERDATHEIYISKYEADSSAYYRSLYESLSDSLSHRSNNTKIVEKHDTPYEPPPWLFYIWIVIVFIGIPIWLIKK